MPDPDNPGEILKGIPMDAMTILTRDQLCAKLLISDTTRQRLEKTDPTFPRKLHVSPRKVGYLLSDVQAYVARQHQKAA
ncbi:AlpA family phage regulatory protein [Mesorhizobium sp. WSM2561]|uniref:helix-turn-helix transcriptional regulator n=1 Tax=Mesorhizobium sp. WSM2561 TaxID=1040985 RepID=UPI0004B375E0|nr:AlpA family phage regulatory protein [Mesorhizobium sp. WSM2561]